MVLWMAFNSDGATGGANPFATPVDVQGVLTHGHLAENNNHGGAPDAKHYQDVTKLPSREVASGTVLPIADFASGIPHVALLVRPALEARAIGFEHLALPRHHAVHGLAPEELDALALGPRGERAHGRGVGGEPLLDEIHEVFARIGVLRQLGRLSENLAQPYVHGAGEGLELIAGVVDVELALDGHALRAQDAREGITDRGRAGVDDGTGGIGGDELEEDATARRAHHGAVPRARSQDLREGPRAPVRGKRHVQEPRARHLERRDHRAHGEILSDRLGDLAWRLAGRASQGKGDVGGIVAVAFFPRHFPEHVVRHRQPRFAQGLSEQRRQEFRD